MGSESQKYDRTQRNELADHVAYELRMVACGAERIWRQAVGQFQCDGLVSNSLIEGFLVHARLLDDFLGSTSRGPKGRDVLAKDFNPDWTAQRALTPSERDEIGAKVAHLADNRTAGFPWATGDLFVRIFNRFEEFVDGCQECHEHFDEVIVEILPVVRIFRP